MTLSFEPFRVDVPDDVLDDLRDRIRRRRLPTQVEGAGWEQGTELGYLDELLDHWAEKYDWRATEARLNAFEQLVTEVDGQRIHLVHARSSRPDALPLLLVHGWPGSVMEFLDVIEPLNDAGFHVVAPSLPGFTFSGAPTQLGWHPRRIAQAFVEVMAGLRYERYGAQGGNWGSIVTANVADLAPDRVVGLHLNFVVARAPEGFDRSTLTPEEQAGLAGIYEWRKTGIGYQELQGTKPQSLGVGLDDSPAMLAAWLVEKFRDWTDCDGDVEQAFSKDQLLANITAYWVTRTGTSSCRIYWEMRQAGREAVPAAHITVPTALANFPGEVTKPPRAWVERMYNLVRWSHPVKGGHFAAMQVPELFVADVSEFFESLGKEEP